MANYVFGVDIGGTTVKIGLFTTQGEMVEKWEITTRTDEGGKYILSDIAASVEDKLAEKRITMRIDFLYLITIKFHYSSPYFLKIIEALCPPNPNELDIT